MEIDIVMVILASCRNYFINVLIFQNL